MERVARQLQMAIAEVLLEGLKDPRVQPVTITEIEVSPDLRHAHVRFTPLGGSGDGVAIAEGLNAARGYIQRQVGQRVRLKYLPVLNFHVDTKSEDTLAMHALLDKLAADREES